MQAARASDGKCQDEKQKRKTKPLFWHLLPLAGDWLSPGALAVFVVFGVV